MKFVRRLERQLRKAMGCPSTYTQPRRDTMLKHIAVAAQTGLEIGPLSHPLVTKSESNGKIFYVDSATKEQLQRKYQNNSYVIVDAIVEADFIWGRQTLPELVNGKTFDYVIASHVIEHVPNMIGWLREIAAVLRDDGLLSLAIPDKRYSFDLKRELTSFGALVESYLLDRRRPSTRDVFDHKALATHSDLVRLWDGLHDPNALIHHNTLAKAWAETVAYHESDEYEDVHVNIMTPASFLEILDRINEIGLLDFSVLDFRDTERNTLEFFATLRRSRRDRDAKQRAQEQHQSIERARSGIARSR